MPANDREGRPTPTFQESAKKFKPGPIARPEAEHDRADMGGTRREAAPQPHLRRRAASVRLPVGAEAEREMSEGVPGTLTEMPGERGGR
jgi:hypothetical protein